MGTPWESFELQAVGVFTFLFKHFKFQVLINFVIFKTLSFSVPI